MGNKLNFYWKEDITKFNKVLLNTIVVITFLIPFINGCSQLEWSRTYQKCQPSSDVPAKPLYPNWYNVQCDSISFGVFLDVKRKYLLLGPPVFPFIPIPGEDTHYVTVSVVSKNCPIPDFGIRQKSSSVVITPESVDTVYKTHRRFRFYLGEYTLDTLEIVFKKYLDCEIPSVTYFAKDTVIYIPINF